MKQVRFKFMQVRLTSFLLVCMFSLAVFSQGSNQRYLDYINKYKGLAIDQMLRHRVPASITLAQGLLETGAGTSTLATKANNHFGIKCGSAWKGPYVLRDDDAPNERFRKYKNAAESYEDHSLFLKKARYASLFNLSIYDYEGWAHGLKKCGYATNPRYAYLLIDLIERYNLNKFDRYTKSGSNIDYHSIDGMINEDLIPSHLVYKNNENYYIIARSGDTFEMLAEETGVSARNLRKYNELPKDYILSQGDVIYLERKRTKASPAYEGKVHIIRNGESLYNIAQRYGIRLKSLYELNDLPDDYVAIVNDKLFIR